MLEQNVKQEILLQMKCNNENIITLYETFEDTNWLYLIFEYCSKGTLYSFIKRKGKLNEDQVFNIIYPILLGVDYLHKQGIIHRDIRPENIYLNENNKILLGNFYWACYTNEAKMINKVEYMPPEVILKHSYDEKVDIWSLGMIFYEMFHGVLPFGGGQGSNILTNHELIVDDKLSIDCQILQHAMLSRVTHHRPTIKQILMCKWMKQMMKKFDLVCPYQEKPLKQSLTQYEIQQSQSQQQQIQLQQKSNSDVKPIKLQQLKYQQSIV